MTDGGEVFRPGGSLGPYEIERRIGEGGMCVVWKGKHRSLGKAVAIKVLSPDHARKESARGRFVQEGQALARIHHDNVIEVHDVGVVGESPYLIMAFLDGADLATLFAARGALSPGELADVMIPVCAGVAAAHDEQIIHRDIKPENIFLARTRDGEVVPKVLDFGISRVGGDPERAHTGTAALMGTPKYMSPEQTRGAKYLDERTDQYSLGVVLYQGATGRLPVEEKVLLPLLQRIERGEFAPPRALRWDLPAEFEALILRAMANAPAQRFPTVRALGAALLPFASERIRAIYGERLSGTPAARAVGRPPPTPWEGMPSLNPPQGKGRHPAQPPSPTTVPGAPTHRTTLGDSARELPNPEAAPQRATKRAVALVALAALSALAVGFAVSLRLAPSRSEGLTASGERPATGVVTPRTGTPTLRPETPATVVALGGHPTPAPQTQESGRALQGSTVLPVERPPEALTALREPQLPPTAPSHGRRQPQIIRRLPAELSPRPSGPTPWERARECTRYTSHVHTVNECFVRALRGRASTMQELALLATTYQALGRRQEAMTTMRQYIERYPTGPRVASFRSHLRPDRPRDTQTPSVDPHRISESLKP